MQEIRGRHGRKAVPRRKLPGRRETSPGVCRRTTAAMERGRQDAGREDPRTLTTSRSVSEKMNVSGTGRGDHFTPGVNHAIVLSGHGVHCFSVRRRGGAAAEGPMCLPHTAGEQLPEKHPTAPVWGVRTSAHGTRFPPCTRASTAPGRLVPPRPVHAHVTLRRTNNRSPGRGHVRSRSTWLSSLQVHPPPCGRVREPVSDPNLLTQPTSYATCTPSLHLHLASP